MSNILRLQTNLLPSTFTSNHISVLTSPKPESRANQTSVTHAKPDLVQPQTVMPDIRSRLAASVTSLPFRPILDFHTDACGSPDAPPEDPVRVRFHGKYSLTLVLTCHHTNRWPSRTARSLFRFSNQHPRCFLLRQTRRSDGTMCSSSELRICSSNHVVKEHEAAGEKEYNLGKSLRATHSATKSVISLDA